MFAEVVTVEFDGEKSHGTAFGKTNVIAGYALAAGDIRTLSKAQLDKAKKSMQEIVAAGMPRTQATLTFDEGYPSLAPTDGNATLLGVYDRASQDLGFGPVGAVNPDKAGAADVSFVAGEVKMIIDGVGLMGRDDHTPGETADLSTLPSQTMRAAVTLYRLFRSGTGA